MPVREDVDRAIELAQRHGITVYDDSQLEVVLFEHEQLYKTSTPYDKALQCANTMVACLLFMGAGLTLFQAAGEWSRLKIKYGECFDRLAEVLLLEFGEKQDGADWRPMEMLPEDCY